MQNENNNANQIWSHATSDYKDDLWTSALMGIRLGAYAMTSNFRGHYNANIVWVGILVYHGYLQTMRLPDLYNHSARGSFSSGVGRLGAYDVMSNPAGPILWPKWPGMLSRSVFKM